MPDQRNAADRLFADALGRRAVAWAYDPNDDAYLIGSARVSLDNLRRSDSLATELESFVDAVLGGLNAAPTAATLSWSLEPNDYADAAALRVSISARLDRVLSDVSPNGGRIRWLADTDLAAMGLDHRSAGDLAFSNLARELNAAVVRTRELDATPLAMLETSFSSKASLMLAPSIRAVLEPAVGWPLLAVAPDRDFLYAWPATEPELTQRLGSIVVNTYRSAAYPLSTEVFEVGDAGVRAIGAYPV